jgi:hypothetical protein
MEDFTGAMNRAALAAGWRRPRPVGRDPGAHFQRAAVLRIFFASPSDGEAPDHQAPVGAAR